jgi:hypothetical protein
MLNYKYQILFNFITTLKLNKNKFNYLFLCFFYLGLIYILFLYLKKIEIK